MRRNKTEGRAQREPVTVELVERCKSGDEAAWARLVEATYRDVYSLCMRILRNPDDAAEATQDAYLKAWRALDGFRGDALFTTWLYRVAANAAISKQRGRRRRRSVEIDVVGKSLAALPALGSTEGDAGARLELRDVATALEQLPEHYRSAVVLRNVYGFSIEELSKQLKISQTAAKVRVHRGRRKLKEMLYPDEQMTR